MKLPALSFGFGKALLLVGACTGMLFGVVACADAEGTTPTCEQDVGDGTHEVKDNGCNPFAVCVQGGKIVDAMECCKGAPEGYERDACLYGYGAGPAPK